MESKQDNMIDEKYLNLGKKGKGGFSKVYLVKDITNNKEYALKVLKEITPSFQAEVDIHRIISQQKHPNIINLIDFGEKMINLNNDVKKRQYMILDYAAKGELFDYLYYPGRRLLEKYAKVMFLKILRAIKAMHDIHICHRDLKIQNIILDSDFNPKVCDFGFATEINANVNNGKLNTYVGTANYAAPEILLNNPYDGYKADIFSLGVILINLVTCKLGFCYAVSHDKYYKYIYSKRYERYWNKIQITNVSNEFKDLYLNMVQYSPEKRIGSIDAVMQHPWFKEILALSPDDFKKLESEIRADFLTREQDVKSKNMTVECDSDEKMEDCDNRGLENEGDKYFKSDLNLKYVKTGINMKDFMKINGNIKPNHVMNKYVNAIKKLYDNKCQIELCENKLKFEIKFPNQDEQEEDEEDNEDKEIMEEIQKTGLTKIDFKKKNESMIQVKCYESENGGYIFKFQKKAGEIEDYCKNLKMIMNTLKKLL